MKGKGLSAYSRMIIFTSFWFLPVICVWSVDLSYSSVSETVQDSLTSDTADSDKTSKVYEPDRNSSSNEYVASVDDEINVTGTGGASYTIQFDLPKGIHELKPQIALAYDSQAGNGIAGWGFNLTGFSVITCVPKDLFHDGVLKGVSYTTGDAYSLDGKRLLLKSGIEGVENAVYTLEGNPFVEAQLKTDSLSSLLYFVVRTTDGKTYEYGRTSNSLLSSTVGGTTRLFAWYVNKVSDALGNQIVYDYTKDSNYIYPSKVEYGPNKVQFYYAYRTDISVSYLSSLQCKMQKRLSYVDIKTDNSTYRRYDLTYDTTSDQSGMAFSRLTKVQPQASAPLFNEKPSLWVESKPIRITWNYLQGFSHTENTLNVSLVQSNPALQIDGRYFLSADMNGDGISDIVQISPVRVGVNQSESYIYAYVYPSDLQNDGTVTFGSPLCYTLPSVCQYDGFEEMYSGINFVDLDGDGLQDLCIPVTVNDANSLYIHYIYYCYVLGSQVRNGLTNIQCAAYERRLWSGNTDVEYVVADFDNDGKSEPLHIEKTIYNYSNRYESYLVKMDANGDFGSVIHGFQLTASPQHIEAGDFNNDGLQDLLVLYDSGYTLFYNQGPSNGAFPFNEDTSVSGSFLSGNLHVFQGDFNGDGLPDMLVSKTDYPTYYYYLCKGDGTFEQKTACTTNLYDQSTSSDDGQLSVLVYDFDHDGKSDVLIGKSVYGSSYTNTQFCWLRSTGTNLSEVKRTITTNCEDAAIGHLLLGDFTGRGMAELMNYGPNIYTFNNNTALHLYTHTNMSPGSGRIKSITDEYLNITNVSYTSLASGNIYEHGSGGSYPFVEYLLPLSVVSGLTTGNGAAGTSSSSYSYGGLMVHLRGKGMVGFTLFNSNDLILGSTARKEIVSWNLDVFEPSTILNTLTLGNEVEVTNDSNNIVLYPYSSSIRNYCVFPFSKIKTDFDGYVLNTQTIYNPTYGYLTQERSYFDDGSYKITDYEDYVYSGYRYQPTYITLSQKHADDEDEYVQMTTYTYNTNGLPNCTVQNSHSSDYAFYTSYTYDSFGNILQEESSGEGYPQFRKVYTYSSSGRDLIQEETVPSTTRFVYVYDTFGRLTSDIDATAYNFFPHRETQAPAPVLPPIRSYKYDPFGNLIKETSFTDIVTDYTYGWGTSASKRYYVLEETDGAPWKKTWYDSRGRATKVESVGADHVQIQEEYDYNNKGLLTEKATWIGELYSTISNTYDTRGRQLSEQTSAGRSTVYSYNGRTVTTTVNGRNYTKTYDAWGNIVTSTDPVSSVTYSYNSMGKPVSVTAAGSTITMSYDDACNRISLNDPDAGITTYSYDAKGRLRTQTDARGNQTNYMYNDSTYLASVEIGNTTTTYSYGTSGNSKRRLVSVVRDGYSQNYQYDHYGRITKETRKMPNEPDLVFSCTYDSLGHVATKTFPNNVTAEFEYDENGYRTRISVNGQTAWKLVSFDGLETVSLACDSNLCYMETCDNNGYLSSRDLYHGATHLDSLQLYFNGATGNLTYRKGVYYNSSEYFSYDVLDRLVECRRSSAHSTPFETLSYSANGNITYKKGIGNYSYTGPRPHAVTRVTNTDSLISTTLQSIEYNALNKIQQIVESNSRVNFNYGPDNERWKSVRYLNNSNTVQETRIYAGDYECVTKSGSTTHFYYLDDNVMYARKITNNSDDGQLYFICKDNVGTIRRIYDGNGTRVFYAYYYPWGRQIGGVTSSLNFFRGYGGHEYLNQFKLVNMNGRLYDPLLGRFLSPDNYVQLPDFSQNFNRYSYCLNNPLKYQDPSGELFGLGTMVGLLKGIWNAVTKGDFEDIYKHPWKNFKNEVKIAAGLLRGSPEQIISRFTWELPQTILGYTYSELRNAWEDIDHIKYFDGATFLIKERSRTDSGITIGSYININSTSYPKDDKGNFAPQFHPLYMHEYGHYIQSQYFGWSFIPVFGIPSLFSATISNDPSKFPSSSHRNHWMERSASRYAKKYFEKNYSVDWDKDMIQYYLYSNNDHNYYSYEKIFPTY